jgi:hypothetical protein
MGKGGQYQVKDKNCFQNWITLRNTRCLLVGYECKPVLKSADENVYLSEKERNIGFKKKTVFKIRLP